MGNMLVGIWTLILAKMLPDGFFKTFMVVLSGINMIFGYLEWRALT